MKYESALCGPIQYLLGASNVSPFGADRVRTRTAYKKMPHQRIWTEAGTSLIELMFATAAGLVVFGATLQVSVLFPATVHEATTRGRATAGSSTWIRSS